jgi:hypothetical protein
MVVSKEMKTDTNYDNGDSVLGLGKLGSRALLAEKFNVINSGVQVFPTAISGFNISRELTNAFGKCSGYQGFNQVQGSTDNDNFPQYFDLLRDGSARAGDLGFNGVLLNNSMVKNLELNIQRDIKDVGNGNNDSLRVFIFGDVAKSISVGKDGSYVIGYV